MSTVDDEQKCLECSGRVVDVGEELVCSDCGIVTGKEVLETAKGATMQAIDFTGQGLGGYLGSAEPTPEERHASGLSGARSSYRYMKLVSDYAGREDGTLYSCAKLIERVCDMLGLPRLVVGEAVLLAKRTFACEPDQRFSTAAVSSLAIINACKIAGAAPVQVREVLDAHRAIGRRVRMSDIIQLSLVSPTRTPPRKPEECLGKVVARLSADPHVRSCLSEEGVKEVPYLSLLREEARRALLSIPEVEKAGFNPWALASTAVYHAEAMCAASEGRRSRLSQKDAGRAAGVAEYTIREQYRRIFKARTVTPRPGPMEAAPLPLSS